MKTMGSYLLFDEGSREGSKPIMGRGKVGRGPSQRNAITSKLKGMSDVGKDISLSTEYRSKSDSLFCSQKDRNSPRKRKTGKCQYAI